MSLLAACWVTVALLLLLVFAQQLDASDPAQTPRTCSATLVPDASRGGSHTVVVCSDGHTVAVYR